MTYAEVLDNELERNEEVATFRTTWPNGNEPDGETTVSIDVVRGETEDGSGYALVCDDNDNGGHGAEAGETVYDTVDDAIAAARKYAEEHDEKI